MICLVPEGEENTREAQDTPVISVESNRNATETKEVIKPRKANKISKASKILDTSVPNVTPTSATNNDDVTTEASLSSGKNTKLIRLISLPYLIVSIFHWIGEGCSDKFKNCHLVVQARLCKLKYYLVSCCASCSKPKTWTHYAGINTHAHAHTQDRQTDRQTQERKIKETVSSSKTWCFLIPSLLPKFSSFISFFFFVLLLSARKCSIVQKKKVVANFYLLFRRFPSMWISKSWLSVRQWWWPTNKGEIHFCFSRRGDGDRTDDCIIILARLANSRMKSAIHGGLDKLFSHDKFNWVDGRAERHGHTLFGWLLFVSVRVLLTFIAI